MSKGKAADLGPTLKPFDGKDDFMHSLVRSLLP